MKGKQQRITKLQQKLKNFIWWIIKSVTYLVIKWLSLVAQNRWLLNLDGTNDIIIHDEGKFLVDGLQILIGNESEWEEEQELLREKQCEVNEKNKT